MAISTYYHQPKRLHTYTSMAAVIENIIAPWCRAHDIFTVFGIPRKGMAAAAMLANVLECQLGSFINKEPVHLDYGTTHPCLDGDAGLILDDGVYTGEQLQKACMRANFHGTGHLQLYCGAVYHATAQHVVLNPNLHLDIVGQVIDTQTDICEWDMWQHPDTVHYMVDFDGVLCPDRDADAIPDKTPEYVAWAQQAGSKRDIPHGVHSVVTWREKYMQPTCEWWLAKHGIKYGNLFCANRMNWSSPAAFKAKCYLESDARLFIESDAEQARTMRRVILQSTARTPLAGCKPVLCTDDMSMTL
jgi:hypothetical protein